MSIQLPKKNLKDYDSFTESNEEKRYAVTIDFYVFAKNDKDVIKKSEMICDLLDKKYDNHANIVEINEQPFGSLKNRKINK